MTKFSLLLLLLCMSSRGQSRTTSREMYASLSNIVEVYWESYMAFPNDLNKCRQAMEEQKTTKPQLTTKFGSNLTELGLGKGHVVNIAFANFDLDECDRPLYCTQYICGLNLFQGLDETAFKQFKKDIKTIRDKGVIVKLAVGGASYGNIDIKPKTMVGVENVVERLVNMVEELDVDGIDLVQNDGCGTANLLCDDQTSIHLAIIEELRKVLPEKIIGYTFPHDFYGTNYPFIDVVKYGQKYLDSITFFGTGKGASGQANEHVEDPKKVILGFPIGCSSAKYRKFNLTSTSDACREVVDMGFKGVAIWSINRDTDRNLSVKDIEEEETTDEEDMKDNEVLEDNKVLEPICHDEQTGKSDGTYLKLAMDIILAK